MGETWVWRPKKILNATRKRKGRKGNKAFFIIIIAKKDEKLGG